jgi:hypothetical protein
VSKLLHTALDEYQGKEANEGVAKPVKEDDMKLYVVIIEDSSDDVAVHPFSDPNAAVESARRIAKEYCRNEAYYEEHDYGRGEGWLFFANYSCEGDSVMVVPAVLDKAL